MTEKKYMKKNKVVHNKEKGRGRRHPRHLPVHAFCQLQERQPTLVAARRWPRTFRPPLRGVLPQAQRLMKFNNRYYVLLRQFVV